MDQPKGRRAWSEHKLANADDVDFGEIEPWPVMERGSLTLFRDGLPVAGKSKRGGRSGDGGRPVRPNRRRQGRRGRS